MLTVMELTGPNGSRCWQPQIGFRNVI
jgi:hypothetical protein